MLSLKLDLQPQLEEKIKYILSSYSDKNIFFKELISNKIIELERSVTNIEKDLRKFELKYRMDSEKFYSEFENGNFGDEDDYMIWSGIFELYLKNQKELGKLYD
jgi:hypothetical protein